jgi:hypothetical protein
VATTNEILVATRQLNRTDYCNELIKARTINAVPLERPISWIYFPKSDNAPEHLRKVTDTFLHHIKAIDSAKAKLRSNEVMYVVKDSLEKLGFIVETKSAKIFVPVLFGRDGKTEKSFRADGYNSDTKTVIEIEAGRAVDNNQFLKDLFEACMMHDIEYLVIAVRKIYRKKTDFEIVVKYFDTLYSSRRLDLPLKGIMIIGY